MGLICIIIVRLIINKEPWQEHDIIVTTLSISSEPSRKIVNGQTYATIWTHQNGRKIGLRLPYEQVAYGDTIEVQGEISLLQSNFGLHHTWWLEPDTYTIQPSHSLLWRISRLRSKAIAQVNRALNPQHAAIVNGMVLGSKQSITPQLDQLMRETGTMHVLVASGFNIMLIVSLCLVSLRFLPSKWSLVITLLVIPLYVLFVGIEGPIVRAALMTAISLTALLLGRSKHILPLFLITLLAMLIYRPVWLFDVGWQLSLVATAGLIWITPLLLFVYQKSRQQILQMPNKHQHLAANDLFESLDQVIVSTIAAQIAVFGIIILNFKYASISSIFSNLLIAWLVPIITIVGMGGTLTMWLNTVVGTLIFQLLIPILDLFTILLNLIANHNFYRFDTQSWDSHRVYTYYGVLLGLVIVGHILIHKVSQNNKSI